MDERLTQTLARVEGILQIARAQAFDGFEEQARLLAREAAEMLADLMPVETTSV